jgi:DNA-binding MarR family transcriptional regulator
VNDCDDIRATAPLWQAILHGAGRLEATLEARLAEAGLSISKLGVLRLLVVEGASIPLSRLADRLSCCKSNVTQLVDRLESEGLVARVPDPSDRRSILATITDAGRERYEAGSRLVAEAEEGLVAGLSAEERDRLRELFGRFAAGCD